MEQTIPEFFMQSWIIVRRADRRTTEEYAIELIWRHGFDAKDSIHGATAVLGRIARMDSFDGDHINRGGVVDSPP